MCNFNHYQSVWIRPRKCYTCGSPFHFVKSCRMNRKKCVNERHVHVITENNALKDTISTLQSTINELNETVANVTEKNERLNAQIMDTKSKMNDYKAEIDDQNEELNYYGTELERYQRDNVSLTIKVNDMEHEFKALRKSKKKLLTVESVSKTTRGTSPIRGMLYEESNPCMLSEWSTLPFSEITDNLAQDATNWFLKHSYSQPLKTIQQLIRELRSKGQYKVPYSNELVVIVYASDVPSMPHKWQPISIDPHKMLSSLDEIVKTRIGMLNISIKIMQFEGQLICIPNEEDIRVCEIPCCRENNSIIIYLLKGHAQFQVHRYADRQKTQIHSMLKTRIKANYKSRFY